MLFQSVAHQKGVVLCLYGPMDLSPVQGVKRTNCSHPQKARMPMSWSSVGITSRSDIQLRNASLPICLSLGGSQTSDKATQCANVELRITVMPVHMRLTSTNRLQFSQALGPML